MGELPAMSRHTKKAIYKWGAEQSDVFLNNVSVTPVCTHTHTHTHTHTQRERQSLTHPLLLVLHFNFTDSYSFFLLAQQHHHAPKRTATKNNCWLQYHIIALVSPHSRGISEGEKKKVCVFHFWAIYCKPKKVLPLRRDAWNMNKKRIVAREPLPVIAMLDTCFSMAERGSFTYSCIGSQLMRCEQGRALFIMFISIWQF